MKFFYLFLFLAGFQANTTAQGILNKVKNKVKQRTDQKTDQSIDKGLDKAEEAAKKKEEESPANTNEPATTDQAVNKPDSLPAKPASFKTYANYDFVPGDTVLFEDNFSEDVDGEFATHWELNSGQAVINNINGTSALLITDGGYGWVSPLMKKKSYLAGEWTVEFDTWRKEAAYQVFLFLQDENKTDLGNIAINTDGVAVNCLDAEGASKTFFGSYPAEFQSGNFFDKWHHVAIAYKNKQVKVYIDQLRAVVVPNTNISPVAIGIGGIASQDGPLIFTNMRIAAGGKMNLLTKKFTDTKIITHGINFDVNKATIKPESMGTLNSIVQIMKANPAIKFEIGGHTDSDGDNPANQKLSQQRAEAVRLQLIEMGIDASRLSAKGYGETKPIADNDTPEGKANNRRVEFVKQ